MISAAVSPPLLLVIDNDARTARRFAAMLEEDGYEVEVIGDGAEAVARMARSPAPDAILTDLVMPRASGIAVLGEARRRWGDIPVLFITGHPELLHGPEVLGPPRPIVFTKPIRYAEVNETLRRMLAAAGRPSA